jgi:lipopolysaccharide exporter
MGGAMTIGRTSGVAAALAPGDGEPEDGMAVPSLERRVRSGAIWSAANSLGIKLGNIAVMVVVVRLVTPTEFGIFAAALTVAVILGSFADWGVSSFLMRSDVDLDDMAPTAAFIAVVSGVALALATVLSAPLLAAGFAAPQAVGPIRVMALCLIIGSLAAVPNAILARNFRQDRIFLSNLVAFVPANTILILLAFEGVGAMAFAWSRVITVACQGLAVSLAVRRWYWPSLDRSRLRRILSFGLPLAGANLINYALLNADYALVGHQLGPALLGIYVLAFNVASWSTSMLAAAINGVAMPAFSRVGQDQARLEAALHRSTRAVCLLALPVATLTVALAEPLIVTLYGRAWEAAIPVLEILGVYGAVFVVVSLLSNLLVGTGHTGRVLLIQLVWIGTLVPAMAAGVRWDGVVGVAWAHVIAAAGIVLPLYMGAVSRQVPRVLGLVGQAALPPLVACGAAVGAALLARALVDGPILELVLGGLAGGAVYLACARSMLRDFASRSRGWSR